MQRTDIDAAAWPDGNENNPAPHQAYAALHLCRRTRTTVRLHLDDEVGHHQRREREPRCLVERAAGDQGRLAARSEPRCRRKGDDRPREWRSARRGRVIEQRMRSPVVALRRRSSGAVIAHENWWPEATAPRGQVTAGKDSWVAAANRDRCVISWEGDGG